MSAVVIIPEGLAAFFERSVNRSGCPEKEKGGQTDSESAHIGFVRDALRECDAAEEHPEDQQV